MKKTSLLLFFLLLAVLALPAGAEEFTLDEKASFAGMNGKSYYQGYSPSIDYASISLCLPIRAERAVGRITVTAEPVNPDVYLLSRDIQGVSVDASQGLYPVRLTIPLEAKWVDGDYPLVIRFSGEDAEGKPLTGTLPYTLRLRGGRPSPETLTPELKLTDFCLNLGQAGNLTLAIHNPTTTLSMTDITLSVLESTGEILMSGSHSMSLPEILPGETATVEVPLTLRSDAAVTPHILELSLDYQALGQPQRYSEAFTLPVSQEIRLEHGAIQVASSVLAGDLTSLSLPLMNMGRGELHNVLVSLDFGNDLPSQSVLAGSLKPGESKESRLTFTATEPGLLEGTLILTCEDAYGNSEQQTFPLSLTVQPQPPKKEEEPQAESKPIQPWLIPTLGAACGLLALALILQGLLLTAKIHRLEEERL